MATTHLFKCVHSWTQAQVTVFCSTYYLLPIRYICHYYQYDTDVLEEAQERLDFLRDIKISLKTLAKTLAKSQKTLLKRIN